VLHQQLLHRADGVQQAVFEAPCLEGVGHAGRQPVPLSLGHHPVQAAVGHDLDRMVGDQQVDQHTVVVLGVPYTQLAEHGDRTFAR
jgi:hypothetical protein